MKLTDKPVVFELHPADGGVYCLCTKAYPMLTWGMLWINNKNPRSY